MGPVEPLATPEAIMAAAVVVTGSVALRLGTAAARRAKVRARAGTAEPGFEAASSAALDLRRDHLVAAAIASASVVAGCLGIATRSVAASFGAAVAVVGAVLAVAAGVRRRYQHRIDAALPGVVEDMARSLRSGASFHQALVDVAQTTPGPLGAELTIVTDKIAFGVGVEDALKQWAQDKPLSNVRVFHGAMGLTMRSGADNGRALDGLAQSMRDKAVVEQETKALVAQAQLSGLVIAALPIGFLAFSLLVDRGAASFLLSTPLGRACLVVAFSLDGLGYLWMRHLAHSVQT